MRDGIGQVGAGQDDRRLAGEDLQHVVQTADESSNARRMKRSPREAGGPMKEHLDEELRRHVEARDMRVADLKKHYER